MPRFKHLLALLALIFLAGFSSAVYPNPPGIAAFEIECKRVTIKEANGRVYVQEQWIFRFDASATNEVTVGGVTIPGGSKLVNPVFSLAGSPFVPLDTNVSPGDRQLIRARLLSQGLFTPGEDSIFYFQTPSAVSFTPLDTVSIHFDFEEGYPVAGTMNSAFTTASDLANGAPLATFDTLIDRNSLNGERYFNKVFPNVGVTQDVVYGTNISVLTGAPAIDTLRMDVYEPLGDSSSARPLVILAHPGTFLPPLLNGSPVGNKNDSAVVEICRQFAERGYVAAAINYRLGWNPVSADQNVRTGTFANALYRGVQDLNTANRFFRKDVALSGNTYGVDTQLVVVGGLKEGALIALAAATLDDESDLFIPKLLDPNTNLSFIDTTLSGNIAGTLSRPLSLANHPGYSSTINAVFSLGGSLIDTGWVDVNTPPIIGLHVPSDPFMPYEIGAVIVPTTGDFVINLDGIKVVLEKNTLLGNQDVFLNSVLLDRYSHVSYPKNDSIEGLFPLFRPTVENAPWEWWDPMTFPNPVPTNPDMSKEKALRYIDTAMYYIARRLPCALSLPNCENIDSLVVGVEQTELQAGELSIYPNPSKGLLQVEADQGMRNLTLYDASGRLLRQEQLQNGELTLRLDFGQLPQGLYFLQVEFENGGLQSQRVLISP